MASQTEKAKYERARRQRMADDRKRDQVLFPWLQTMRPEVLAEFNICFTRLNTRNPRNKNLTVTDDFRKFRRRGKGEYYVFSSTRQIVLRVHDFLYSFFVR